MRMKRLHSLIAGKKQILENNVAFIIKKSAKKTLFKIKSCTNLTKIMQILYLLQTKLLNEIKHNNRQKKILSNRKKFKRLIC